MVSCARGDIKWGMRVGISLDDEHVRLSGEICPWGILILVSFSVIGWMNLNVNTTTVDGFFIKQLWKKTTKQITCTSISQLAATLAEASVNYTVCVRAAKTSNNAILVTGDCMQNNNKSHIFIITSMCLYYKSMRSRDWNIRWLVNDFAISLQHVKCWRYSWNYLALLWHYSITYTTHVAKPLLLKVLRNWG